MKTIKISLTLILLLLNSVVLTAQKRNKNSEHDWRQMVILSRTFGANASSKKIGYFKNTNVMLNGWLIPWGIEIQSSDIDDDYFKKSGYLSGKLNYLSIGRNGFKSFRENTFYNISTNILFGMEELKEFSFKEKDNLVIGISLSQGIVYIPKSIFGFVVGCGVYEKFLTSKIYPFDVGIEISAGLKW